MEKYNHHANKLQHMSNRRHLEIRYMQIMIKPCKVKYGSYATNMLRNNKHTKINPAPPEDGSTAPLETAHPPPSE